MNKLTIFILVLAGLATSAASTIETHEYMLRKDYIDFQAWAFAGVLSLMIFSLWNIVFLKFDRYSIIPAVFAAGLSVVSIATVYDNYQLADQQAQQLAGKAKDSKAETALTNAINELKLQRDDLRAEVKSLAANIRESERLEREYQKNIKKNYKPKTHGRLLKQQQKITENARTSKNALMSDIKELTNSIADKESEKGVTTEVVIDESVNLDVLVRSALWDASTPILAMINALLLMRIRQSKQRAKQQADQQADRILEKAEQQAENRELEIGELAEKQLAEAQQKATEIIGQAEKKVGRIYQKHQEKINAAEVKAKKIIATAEANAELIQQQAKIDAKAFVESAKADASLVLTKAKHKTVVTAKKQQARKVTDAEVLDALKNKEVNTNTRDELSAACLHDQFGIGKGRAKRIFEDALSNGYIERVRNVYGYATAKPQLSVVGA